VTERLRIQRSPSSSKRGRRSKPPLVDSDLLRFLKTTQSQYISNDENRCFRILRGLSNSSDEELADSLMSTNETIALVPPKVSSSDLSFDLVTGAEAGEVSEGRSNFRNDGNRATQTQQRPFFIESDDDALMHQWLKQYECTYVSSLLKDKGANAEASFAVGMVIERMSLVRAAQKRLRSYFKERNCLWNAKYQGRLESTSILNNSYGAGNSMDNESAINCATSSEDNFDLLTFSTGYSNHMNMAQVVELLIEYGLSTKDICEILISSPSLAFMQPRPASSCTVDNGTTVNGRNRSVTPGQSLQEILDRVFLGLLMGRNGPHELKLRKYDARKLLRNTPGILTVRGSESAIQMVQLLISLGVSSNSLSRDKNSLPILLSRQPSAVFRLVAFLSSDAVRMPIHKIGPLLRRSECQDLLNAIAPCRTMSLPRISSKEQAYPSQLGSLYNDRIGSGRGKVVSAASVVAQVQKVVVNDIYRRMSETAWTLRNKIGTQDLGRVIAAYPSVLLLDAARQILPTAQYLMNELAILPNDLPSVLQLYPALLRTDVEQMRNVVSYLTSLEVAEDNLGIIFRSFPVLLTLDIEHDMEPVVAFLQSIGVSNVGRFVSRLPPILGYSVENELRPKYEYLASISSDARFKITKFPAYFSYPLERVIKSRFEYLRNVKRIPTPLLSLDHILCSGDRDFAIKVARDFDVTHYARFVEELQQAHRANGYKVVLGKVQESLEPLSQQQDKKILSPSSSSRNVTQATPEQSKVARSVASSV
jgi:mTERF